MSRIQLNNLINIIEHMRATENCWSKIGHAIMVNPKDQFDYINSIAWG